MPMVHHKQHKVDTLLSTQNQHFWGAIAPRKNCRTDERTFRLKSEARPAHDLNSMARKNLSVVSSIQFFFVRSVQRLAFA